jgi:hypothetical protein
MATPPYKLAHARVRSRYGAARNWFCVFCALRADDCALSWDATDIQSDSDGRAYSLDPDQYVSLCRTCHKAYDAHVAEHGTDGVTELIARLYDAVNPARRDVERRSVINSITSLMRVGYLRPGRDRAFRAQPTHAE